MNVSKGNIKANIIDAPDYGINRKQTLQDFAALTGATVINEDLGDDMDLIDVSHLGTCLKVVTTSDDTIIQVEKINDDTKALIKQIKKEIKSNQD